MIEQLKTLRAAVNLLHPDVEQYKKAVEAITQLEAMVGEQKPVACVGSYWNDGKGFDLCDFSGNRPAPGAKLYAAPVAQQPQEIEVQCPVCNHKFYEWPNDKQPQAEAVPPTHVLVPIDVLEAASESLGSFVSDQGWTTLDMQAMDNLDAILAQQKGGV